MNKKALSERDICSKFITPAVVNAGWDLHTWIREKVTFTKGRIMNAAEDVATIPTAKAPMASKNSGS